MGYKAAMGPYASTLPFAYTFLALLFLADFRNGTYKRRPWFPQVLFFLASIGILLTLSRAAIFVLLILYVIRVLFSKHKWFIIPLIYLVVASFSSLVRLVPDRNVRNYTEQYILNIDNDGKGSGTSSRLSNNVIDFHYGLRKPLLGHGSGVLLSKKQSGVLTSADSSYLLTIFADRGLLSVLIFSALILITFKKSMSMRKIIAFNYRYSSLNYSLLALLLCLNSSQRVEALFLLFFILGAISKLYKITKEHAGISTNPNI